MKNYSEAMMKIVEQFRTMNGDYKNMHFFATLGKEGRMTLPLEIRKVNGFTEGTILGFLVDGAMEPEGKLPTRRGALRKMGIEE